LAVSPARLARALSDVARAAPGVARFALSSERADAALPFTAPRGPLNGTLTARRGFAYCSIPLADVLDVKQAFGVTMNDVVLAMCAGALRQYLQGRDQLPNRPLVAQVPIAVGREDQRGKLEAMPGNLLSGMGAALPVHLDGPGDRLRAVHASTRAAKRLHAAFGKNLLSELVGIAPPSVTSALVGMYRRVHFERVHPPIFSAVVSSVAGPPVTVYSCGARLLAAYPFGPLFAGSGLNITVMTYAGSLDVGITVCPDIVEAPWEIAEALPPALTALLQASEHAPTQA
jgi:WS/DGAT/MGAT family acyltransferase